MAVKTNEILIGSQENPILALDNDSIISVNGNLACDLLCETIPVDTLEIQCRYDRMQVAFSPIDYDGMRTSAGKQVYARSAGTEDVLNIPYASGLWYYNGRSYVGKFYVVDAQRTGKTIYTIKAQSAIGVLDAMTYYGRLFVNKPISDVVHDIILTDGLEPTETPFLLNLYESVRIDPDLTGITITGWIPVCTKRNALHQVLFAHGLNILKSDDDAFLIARIPNEKNVDIDPNNEYQGGSVDLVENVKEVEITEHSFVRAPNADPQVLFDNTESFSIPEMVSRVVFDSAPVTVDTLTTTGSLEILKANENCAIVRGFGTLSGIPCSHGTNVLTRKNEAVVDGKSVSVNDATLVNSVNSSAVLDRIYLYYSSKRAMRIPIVLNGEKCGKKYLFHTPFGDTRESFISEMTISSSAIAKADCTVVTGYEPNNLQKAGFSHMVCLTDSGVFTVPDEVLNSENPLLQVIIIGGGQGGSGGQGGEPGRQGFVRSISQLAKPGKNGKNGSPGRILRVLIDKNSLKEYYSYSCGSGGEGSNMRPYGTETDPGAFGTESFFGDYSSNLGAVPSYGFLDPLSGNVYGGPSPDYSNIIKSGRGGGAVQEESGYWYAVEAEPGVMLVDQEVSDWLLNNKKIDVKVGTLFEFQGGYGAIKEEIGSFSESNYFLGVSGGGVGGPLFYKNNPNNNAWYDGGKTTISGTTITLGSGGKPGTLQSTISPFVFSPTAWGQGGLGGQGGPGCGSSGACIMHASGLTVVEGKYYEYNSYGAKGGDGAPGCILVYY